MTTFPFGAFNEGFSSGFAIGDPAPQPLASAVTEELLTYIAPDGERFQLSNPVRQGGRWVITETGWGAPPVQIVARSGPFQHGQTVVEAHPRPRRLDLLLREEGCSREDYYRMRARLVNRLRPNRQTTPAGVEPGELRKTLPDGRIRSLHVYIAEGPQFTAGPANTWDEWAYQELIRFIAPDPILFDPVPQQVILAVGGSTVFPYPGTWYCQPTITITGPITNPTISNDTLGAVIKLEHTVVADRVVTLDLRGAVKTITDDLGNNLIGTVSEDSNLADWALIPHPQAPDGDNTITTGGSGTSGATGFAIRCQNRYWGA